MTRRPGPRRTARAPQTRITPNGRQTPAAADISRQVDDIYLKMDAQLTRQGEIQLQFDQLRSKIRKL